MMHHNGISSPEHAIFPSGLRVLVVDDDPMWLRILEKMLKKCSYQVTTCGLARDALKLLRERKDGYDIVISDANMPDMDGFILLELVGLEMDVPVIMMSVDGETRRVMKGVQHGACDYLLKPIRMKELRNIWQHVLRKRMNNEVIRDTENYESTEGSNLIMVNGFDTSEDERQLFSAGDLEFITVRKRKDVDDTSDDNAGWTAENSSTKKARVFWTVDLHQKFVSAVHLIGFDKVGPKKILDLMSVPWLTRENVASHLQKYRLYLSRLQKDNGIRASLNSSIACSGLSPNGPTGFYGAQNPFILNQSNAASGNYGFNSIITKTVIQNADPNICLGDLKGISELKAEQKPEPNRLLNPHEMGAIKNNIKNNTGYNFTAASEHSWSRDITEISCLGDIRPSPKPLAQSVISIVDRQPLVPISTARLNIKPCDFTQNCANDMKEDINASMGMNIQVQAEDYMTGFTLEDLDFLDSDENELIVVNDPFLAYNDLRFDQDYMYDIMGYSISEQWQS